MSSYALKRQRLDCHNDLSGTNEHSQQFTGAMNGYAAHQATYEHHSNPFSSAGGDVVSAGQGVFVPQFVVSSAEGSMGLTTHRSSMPIVYTQAPSQSAMVLNSIHSIPQGLRPLPGVLEHIQTKQQASNGGMHDSGYHRGHGEPVLLMNSQLTGFPTAVSYEDTENRYVTLDSLEITRYHLQQV